MKLRFEVKSIKSLFSRVSDRRKKEAPGADIREGSIRASAELSQATQLPWNTNGARNDALDDDSSKMASHSLINDTRNIGESESQASHIDTIAAGGFLNNPHHFIIKDSMLVDQSTNIINRGADDGAAKAKKLLSKHIIPGAAHDSSARDPPPKCHPGTRIKINETIIAWFYSETKRELVLWIYGPAGVGKSAIVQTFAETLALAKCLGASVFFSRPNGRDNSHGVFITIAYQLAVHIEPYCAFVSERLASDPELVNKSMEEQFKAFIVEPFVLKKIGAGGKTWGILLDGLDELDHHHQQQKIISLVTTFAHNHPEVPLVWVISSRPEPHITNTFKHQKNTSSYLEEYVPIDSPESCQDVERFLRSSLQTIQAVKFPHIVTKGWPEETKIVKLADAASGLFAFADVAVRFVEDPHHSDPINRLDDVLSVIDGSRVHSVDDQPFAHLDALYTRILNRIPSKMWPTTQRLLGAIPSSRLHCVKQLSVVLGLELSTIYPSLNYFYSVLDIPPLDDIYSNNFAFHHASFADFLYDATRSKEFYTSRKNADRDLLECGFGILLDFRRQYSAPGSKYRPKWFEYASQFHSGANQPRHVLSSFNSRLFDHIHESSRNLLRERWKIVKEEASEQSWDQFLDSLCQVDAATACHGFGGDQPNFIHFLFDIWEEHWEELTRRGAACEIQLEELQLDHLEWPKKYPTDSIRTFYPDGDTGTSRRPLKLCSPETLNQYISDLNYLQQNYPELQVLIYGPPRSRFAVFSFEFREDDFKACPLLTQGNQFDERFPTYGYYCIPYLDNVQ